MVLVTGAGVFTGLTGSESKQSVLEGSGSALRGVKGQGALGPTADPYLVTGEAPPTCPSMDSCRLQNHRRRAAGGGPAGGWRSTGGGALVKEHWWRSTGEGALVEERCWRSAGGGALVEEWWRRRWRDCGMVAGRRVQWSRQEHACWEDAGFR